MATRVKVGTLFLNNNTGYGVAGGAATGEGTTPWVLRNADWTPQGAQPVSIWGGGPPFNIGSVLAYQGYSNVVERVPLLLDVSNHDDAANELQLLRKEVALGISAENAVLEIKPDGSTNSMYANVLTGWVQEEGILVPPLGAVTRMRVTLTIVRTPFFGRLSTGEILINALTFANTGTGSPSNLRAYSTGVGDLINEGSPLNCAISLPQATVGPPGFISRVYAASVLSRTYSTSFSGSATTSDTGEGVTIGSQVSVSVAGALTNPNLTAFFMCRLTSASANAQFRVKVRMNPLDVFEGTWQDNEGTVGQLLSLGGFSLRDLIRRSKGLTAPTIDVQFYIRSTSGSVSATVTYGEVLMAYSMCKLDLNLDANTRTLLIDCFAEQTNVPCLPWQGWRAVTISSNSLIDMVRRSGRPPIYVSGASLYLAWRDDIGTHTTTEQASAIVTHASLWKTFRGSQ